MRNEQAETRTTVQSDGSMTSVTPWGHAIAMEAVAYALLTELDPLLGERYPVPAK